MIDKDFINIMDNQELIAPEKASKLMSKIVEFVGTRVTDGHIVWYNNPCKIEFKRNRREVRFVTNDTYMYMINPRYRGEHRHVRGLQDKYDGIYDDGTNKYYLCNWSKTEASIYKLK